ATPIPPATPPRTARERLEAYALALPSATILFGVALFPIVATAWLSLFRMIIVFHQRRFIGLGNYRFLLHDPRFWTALSNTACFALFSVSAEVALGVGLALLLDARAPGRAWLRAAVLVPWAIPSAVSSKIWAWLLNPEYGLLTPVLFGRGVN